MNIKQLNAATKLAQDNTVRFINDDGSHVEDISIFEGYGLHSFKPVIATIRQLAALIRWQCIAFDGTMQGEALQEIAANGKRKFTIVGEGA